MINHDVQKLQNCFQHALREDDITKYEIEIAHRNVNESTSMYNEKIQVCFSISAQNSRA